MFFFDTGIEWSATKRHLDELEKIYNIKIQRVQSKNPIPVIVKKVGEPFINKHVSDMIDRLQSHNFNWADEDFETLYKRYPKCKCALKWWCNKHTNKKGEAKSSLNINHNKYLKEFMIANPPKFKISKRCCDRAKKIPAKQYYKEHNIGLVILGIRKAEGGVRSNSYKSCFLPGDKYDIFLPMFWFKGKDKKTYTNKFSIKHSDCYCKYGLKRTGCAGCPYGLEFEHELAVMKIHEPNLYKAVNNIFKNSYAYTRQYRKFREQESLKQKTKGIYKLINFEIERRKSIK